MGMIRKLTVFKGNVEIASNLTTIQAAELTGMTVRSAGRYYEEGRTTRNGYRFTETSGTYEKNRTRNLELLKLYKEWDEVRQLFVR